ncbi:MAG: sarcosine oxidase subunit gamma [Gammaproteobacteria bacterium]|jgi:heterotetrameric sarcosine oxidase gamma subunit
MPERISALDGHYRSGRFGSEGDTGVCIQLVNDLILQQVAAWPQTLNQVGELAAQFAEAAEAPGPGRSTITEKGAILRIEPLKWWLIGIDAVDIEPDLGSTLDLSHSRTLLRLTGPKAPLLLNRFLPIDLRDSQFREGAVASSAMHHVGITLWRSTAGYELFIPRGFALSTWEVLFESAQQFGVQVL